MEEGEMSRIIRCECGYVARGETDAEVLDDISAHMSSDHPALFRTVDRKELLGWIQLE
jgi:predicted small metal-binding protein